jgi:hypothetical protein
MDSINQEQFNEICEGMDSVNDEMVRKIEASAPKCHFMKMKLEQSDSVDGYYSEWWECSICGHIKIL